MGVRFQTERLSRSTVARRYDRAMEREERSTLAIVELILDGIAMNEAALDGDWEEARFRCCLVCAGAAGCGLIDVGVEAAALGALLGGQGAEPRPGYGAAMLAISDSINALRY